LGIHATQVYLDRFFANLLFGENNALKNRNLHVSKGLDVTLDILANNNSIATALADDSVSENIAKYDSVNDSVTDNVNKNIIKYDIVNEKILKYDSVNKKNLKINSRKITKSQHMILNMLDRNPHNTAAQMALQADLSISTVNRALSALKKAGLIKRIGSDKSGHWLLLLTVNHDH
jgi:predicted HTH transcriptional regulator